jgi:hypothetical protein
MFVTSFCIYLFINITKGYVQKQERLFIVIKHKGGMQGLKTVNRESSIEYRETGNDTEDRGTAVPQDA